MKTGEAVAAYPLGVAASNVREHGPTSPRDALYRDLAGLVASWRQDAETLWRRGAAAAADLLESCASDLDARAATRAIEMELLTLQDAERETGLSYSGLWKAMKRGAIRNYGRRGSPRIRRGDLDALRKSAPLALRST